MEPITKISHIPASRWALSCSLCKECTGTCIQVRESAARKLRPHGRACSSHKRFLILELVDEIQAGFIPGLSPKITPNKEREHQSDIISCCCLQSFNVLSARNLDELSFG